MRTDAAPLGWGWTARAVIGLIGLLWRCRRLFPALRAQAGTVGEWKTLGVMPINPVHAALMNNGKVLIVSGSGNVAAETNFKSAVLDPLTGALVQTYYSQSWDMFCNGMVVLSDGRVFVNGGNLKYDPFWGQPKNAVFDPATSLFTDVQNMAHGRWYPTVTTLGDGRVMTFSGLTKPATRIPPSRFTRLVRDGVRNMPRAGRLRSTHGCTCCPTATCCTRDPVPDRGSSTRRPRRGRVSSPPRITPAREATARLSCCR